MTETAAVSPKKILIVDDDQFLRDMCVAAFETAGFAVTSAADGEEAWEKVRSGYLPDAVLTGILMPRMTGFDFVRKMQGYPQLASIPVAIFSHRGREEDRQTAKELNVDDFIIQGTVPLVEIVRRVRALVGDVQNYRIYLKRFHDDAEALLTVLEEQEQADMSVSKDEIFFLELTPLQSPGEFRVKAVVNRKPILEQD